MTRIWMRVVGVGGRRIRYSGTQRHVRTSGINDLENSRGVSARTRNLRLTAIRSFFRFSSYELPCRSAQIQRMLATPRKRYTRRLIGFLTRPEVEALLSAPDKKTWIGRRDHALMTFEVMPNSHCPQVPFRDGCLSGGGISGTLAQGRGCLEPGRVRQRARVVARLFLRR
jgi:hypothetical protein